MAQFPCLPIWTDAWVADTDHLSVEEEGMYFRLVRVMWRTPGCRVPNDDAWLIKHLRLTGNELDRLLKPLIFMFCQNDGNWITQKRLQREYVTQFEFRHRQSDRSKSRWRKKKDPYRNDAGPHSQPTLPLTPKKTSSLNRIDPALVLNLNPNTPVTTASQDHPSARSHRYGAPDGALARSPQTNQDQPKQGAIEEVKNQNQTQTETLAEFNIRWRGQ